MAFVRHTHLSVHNRQTNISIAFIMWQALNLAMLMDAIADPYISRPYIFLFDLPKYIYSIYINIHTYIYIYDCWKKSKLKSYVRGSHDVRDASLVCESSQFLTAWRLVLSMKPWSYIWLDFGLFSTIIAIIRACACWALFVVTLTNTVHLIYIYIYIYTVHVCGFMLSTAFNSRPVNKWLQVNHD